MLCEKCQRRQATIHLTEIIKDLKSELHLCEHCAKEVGLNSKLSNFTISVPEMLSFLDVGELERDSNSLVCQSCGLSYTEFRSSGMLGCPECYISFEKPLESIILGHHGEKKHLGKNPNGLQPLLAVNNGARKEKMLQSLEELHAALEKAVFEERYEEAAALRDRIRNLE